MFVFRFGQLRDIFVLIVIFLSFFTSTSASTRVDSLKNILLQTNLPDTTLINVNLTLSEALIYDYPAHALEHALTALSIAEELNIESKIADALLKTGNIYWQLENFKLAFDFYLEAHNIYTRIHEPVGMANSLTSIGIILSGRRHFQKALEYFTKAYDIFEKTDDLHGKAELLRYIGEVYFNQGEFGLAESYHFRSIEINEKLYDSTGLGKSYNALGRIFKRQLRIEEAREVFLKAFTIWENQNDTLKLAGTYSNLGNLSINALQYDAANEYFSRALGLFSIINHQRGVASTYNSLGKVAAGRNDLFHSEQYFEKSLEIAAQYGLDSILAINYMDMAQLKNRVGDLRNAFYFQSKRIDLMDKWFDQETKRINDELQFVLNREMKEFELLQIQKDEENNFINLQDYNLIRNFLIAGVVMILVLLFLLYNRFLMVRNSNRLLEKQKSEISMANHRLIELNYSLLEQKRMFEEINNKLNISNQKLIESEKHLIETNATKDKFFSIISHDLRNPFASIVSFSRILKRDIDNLNKSDLQELAVELDKSVLKINNLLENLLNWSRTQTGKIKYKPEYIALNEIVKEIVYLFENNAKGKGIEVVDEVDNNLAVWADKDMTETILRNLLSNALKYTLPDGKVRITSSIENHQAHISVIDNGIGMTEQVMKKIFRTDILHSTYGTADEKGSGIGLLLCKEFAERQGGGITFDSEPDKGTTFTFSIPLQPGA